MDLTTFYFLGGIAFLFSIVVRNRMISTYKKWERIPNSARLTGAQTARTILDANELRHVAVEAAPGRLTDHYDPRTKLLRLSEPNYAGSSIAALAIAAHEVGHALQDATAYGPLKLRNALVPLANAGARFGVPVTLVGAMLNATALVQIGMLAYVGALLVQFVTLPVEFNASRRAIKQLETLGLMTSEERTQARSVLRAAAMTYVAGVASAAIYVIYIGFAGIRWLVRKPVPTP